MKSIVQDEKECYVCKRCGGLEVHHIFYGTGLRKISEEEGMKVWLCHEHHTGNTGVHFNRSLDLKLKARAEQIWLDKNNKTVLDFIKKFEKNYL